MPTFDVMSPDGRKFRVTAPEGATQEQIIAYAQQNMPKAAEPKEDAYTATAKDDSVLQNLGASIGGAMYAPVLGVRQMLGKATPQDVQEWKDSMAGLWSTPTGKIGTVLGGVATAAPLAMIPGANTTAGAALGGLAYGAAQPVGAGDSRLAQAVEGMGGGVAGKYIGQGIGAGVGHVLDKRAAALATEKSQNAVRDATLRAAQEAGYVAPPSQVNPSLVNRAAEGFAGKITTAQQASAKNQALTNAGVRADLNLPPETAIAKETLATVRQQAHATGYVPLENFGTIKADTSYAEKVLGMANKYDASVGNIKSLRNPDVEELFKDAQQLSFDSKNVVEFVRNLREQGFANKSPMLPAKTRELGKAQIELAGAIEDLTERNLARAGQGDLLKNYREARKTIAKTFTAEKALNQATGNVDATKLAGMLKKGKPLSGNMLDSAKAAMAFPATMRENLTSMPGLSPLDYTNGILASIATGHPVGLAAALSRPVVRSALLSGPYQKLMVQPPNYEMGLLGRNAKHLNNDTTRRLLQSLGISVPAEQ